MANTLQDFIGSMSTAKGFARLSRFEVEIHPPPGMDNWLNQQTASPGISDYARVVSLHCDTIAMPGLDLKTQDIQHGSAPVRKQVTAHGYKGECAATFYLDAQHNTKSFFEVWQYLAVNPATHKANYYDNYVGSVKIFQLVGNSRTYGVELEEAYPETVGDLSYTFAGGAEGVATVSVSFHYHKWHTLSKLD